MQASNIFDFIISADDTTLSNTPEIVLRNAQTFDTESKLNNELANVSNWLKLYKLSLNVKKSKYIKFHMPKKHVNILHLARNGAAIDRVLIFQFLGLTLDENLNWKCHINKISNKISKSIDIINKLKHFIPIKTKVLIYNSLIVSHIKFCILVWGYQCDRMIKLQKKVKRTLNLNRFYLASLAQSGEHLASKLRGPGFKSSPGTSGWPGHYNNVGCSARLEISSELKPVTEGK